MRGSPALGLDSKREDPRPGRGNRRARIVLSMIPLRDAELLHSGYPMDIRHFHIPVEAGRSKAVCVVAFSSPI